MTRRQVFGLTGGGASAVPTSVASQLVQEPVLLTRSFPITAAGQSRPYTGFPLATPGIQANRRSDEHSTSPRSVVSRRHRVTGTERKGRVVKANGCFARRPKVVHSSRLIGEGGGSGLGSNFRLDSCCRLLPTRIPALPFCHTRLERPWRPAGYPCVLNHLGDHLRKRRMDLGLQLKDAARQLGAHQASVAHWEAGRFEPDLRHLPAVIGFLGYDPRPQPTNAGERLVRLRKGLGLSQKDLAGQLGIDPSTLAKWEVGRRAPQGTYLVKVEALFCERENSRKG